MYYKRLSPERHATLGLLVDVKSALTSLRRKQTGKRIYYKDKASVHNPKHHRASRFISRHIRQHPFYTVQELSMAPSCYAIIKINI